MKTITEVKITTDRERGWIAGINEPGDYLSWDQWVELGPIGRAQWIQCSLPDLDDTDGLVQFAQEHAYIHYDRWSYSVVEPIGDVDNHLYHASCLDIVRAGAELAKDDPKLVSDYVALMNALRQFEQYPFL